LDSDARDDAGDASAPRASDAPADMAMPQCGTGLDEIESALLSEPQLAPHRLM
jgi:hypothetical protein